MPRGLSYSFLAEKEVPEPFRFALQDEFCGPGFYLTFVLRSGKTVQVCPVSSDLDEDSKVLLDKLGFVLGPDGVANPTVATNLCFAARWKVGK